MESKYREHLQDYKARSNKELEDPHTQICKHEGEREHKNYLPTESAMGRR